MNKKHLRPLILLGCLIALTCTAMAYATKPGSSTMIKPHAGTPLTATNGIVTLSGNLTQNKIHTNGDGTVALSLTLAAADIINLAGSDGRNVDMVIVLDRSGSMQGQKIEDAKQAVLNLITTLSTKDRIALVSYSDGVQRHSSLLHATPANRNILSNAVHEIYASGGTNLGAGLDTGINILKTAKNTGNLGRIILVSDGQANQGITDPERLGAMAFSAVKHEFAVTTVGVGIDFNEMLMTSIADRGTGNYYFLENPESFAEVFLKEFNRTRVAAATSVEVRIPLDHGISLIQAAGYPIEINNNQAIFRPGDLLSGQARKLFITLKVPTNKEQSFDLKGIQVAYSHKNQPFIVELADSFHIACVADQQAVFASIDKTEWEEKVMQEDFNNLRKDIAQEIREGRKEEALNKISTYRAAQETVGKAIGSAVFDSDGYGAELDELRDTVSRTFAGAPAAVAVQQKQNAKMLQYEGLKGMRAIK
ncbi:MAG: VWA domain-containing protein [Proteobacteria bacterium]|nr:VWA domain-containing protein [Pseudomonadota bacterium]MBU1711340.1 VWA domain-containing protein [Pseudomonadota bacterium]